MKTGIYFTGTGPILILTSYDSFVDEALVAKLATKGIRKFIVYEVSTDLVRERYGTHFNIVMGDLYQTDDLRVLDYDGHHIFDQFSMAELGGSVCYEA
ncbi:hypothetical protein BVX99_00855 [bacterium F16]|nr:hypothetical protein BVX99_00855 [bacterium F16]